MVENAGDWRELLGDNIDSSLFVSNVDADKKKELFSHWCPNVTDQIII